MPLWLLKFLKKRREAKFLQGVPDAVDVIVRGIKAGLPLLDSMRIIASDAQEPVKSEFRAIIETQAIGMPLGEACGKLYERIPCRSATSSASSSRSSRRPAATCRRRSATCRGAARPQEDEGQDPGHVDGGEGLRLDHRRPADRGDDARLHHQPDYIELLWTHPMGRMMLVGCAAWMTIGVLVMRK